MLPDNTLSSIAVSAPFLPPDDRPREPLIDWERGGIGISDASLCHDVQNWKAWYAGNVIWVAPEADLSAKTAVLELGGVTELALAFDISMHVTLVYMRNGLANLYWYDTNLNDHTTTPYQDITSPRLTLDDKRESQSSVNDVLFFYLKFGQLRYRQQRDRFLIERVLADVPDFGARIENVGMTTGNRVEIRFYQDSVVGGYAVLTNPIHSVLVGLACGHTLTPGVLTPVTSSATLHPVDTDCRRT